jgi:hypothetical protein
MRRDYVPCVGIRGSPEPVDKGQRHSDLVAGLGSAEGTARLLGELNLESVSETTSRTRCL